MKILLIEDDLSVSEWLVETLSAHRYAVDAIADGAAGLTMALGWPYDLVILDWVLPSLDGIEVCRRLRSQGVRTPVLMLTVRGANADIVAGLDAGADDYLAKSSDATQLLARVRALLRRRDRTTTPVLEWGELCLDPALTQVTYQGQPVPCRPKEYELLELFLRSPQRLLTRSAIIDHLWPMDDPPVEGSVTNLIKDLRQRLKRNGLTANPIETVHGLGYRLKLAPAVETPAIAADPGAANPVAAAPGDVSLPLDRIIQQATQRFRASLTQRLTVLEEAAQALEHSTFDAQQRQLACLEAHKLAGGLGLFGYTEAAAVAEAMEALLQSTQPCSQLPQQLEALKQCLTLSSQAELTAGVGAEPLSPC
ncbi:response regulator transcription factor [Nodosilinea sp. E11]|uniref:response regulator transcription factor n=1 Tax=Nodosilinea sp. E11 TaxID=3037479 RepID=UPI0029352930|nr:response regulator transcription factor [Nodosilinea sp. E11]WOD40004.1 response regulator transcription factor [Nodosilinea sp. E11]